LGGENCNVRAVERLRYRGEILAPLLDRASELAVTPA
jgi:hypothetical protein